MAPYHGTTLRIDHVPSIDERLITIDGTPLGRVLALSGDGRSITVELAAGGDRTRYIKAMAIPDGKFEVVSVDEMSGFPSYAPSWMSSPRRASPFTPRETKWTTAPLPTPIDPIPMVTPLSMSGLIPSEGTSWWVEDPDRNLHLITMLDAETQHKALTGHDVGPIMLAMTKAVTMMVGAALTNDETTQLTLYWNGIKLLIGLGVAKEETDAS